MSFQKELRRTKNVYPSFESPHTIYFDVDLTLIELYHLGDFDNQNVLEAYEALMDRAIILLEFPHPDFVSLVEETKRRERRPKIIYDYIDNWNSSLGWTWYTPETESKIIGMTDHLIASAVTLQEELKQRTKGYVSLIPNDLIHSCSTLIAHMCDPPTFPSGLRR